MTELVQWASVLVTIVFALFLGKRLSKITEEIRNKEMELMQIDVVSRLVCSGGVDHHQDGTTQDCKLLGQ